MSARRPAQNTPSNRVGVGVFNGGPAFVHVAIVIVLLCLKHSTSPCLAKLVSKLGVGELDAELLRRRSLRGEDHFAEKVVRAKAAVARSDLSGARQLAEAAVNLQDKLPYMEPPYWYVPVDQALGAIFVEQRIAA